MNINKHDLKFLIYDPDSYMEKSGKMSTQLSPNLIYVASIAYLFHNVCLLIKNTYVNIYNIITSTKTSTIKNQTEEHV